MIVCREGGEERGNDLLKALGPAVHGFIHGCPDASSGPPVPPYEVPGLFEPFHRLPTTERLADFANATIRRGAGLGLSIVQSVAHAHDGDVHASPREDGGLSVRVRIHATAEKTPPNST